MESIVGIAPKIASGIDAVDDVWGGFYLGGSYLIYGRAASGRGLVPIVFAQAGSELGGKTLYISSHPVQDVSSRAASLGIDLDAHADVVEIPRSEPSEGTSPDDHLASLMADLAASAQSRLPERIVVDDFMPFVRFQSFDRFRESVISLLERIDAIDATLMLLMAEPANEPSEKVIAFMRNQMTAAIHVQSSGDGLGIPPKKLILLPGIGHAGQQAECVWRPRRVPGSGEVADPRRRFRFAEEEPEISSLLEARWEEIDEPFEEPGEFPEIAKDTAAGAATEPAVEAGAVAEPAEEGGAATGLPGEASQAGAWRESDADLTGSDADEYGPLVIGPSPSPSPEGTTATPRAVKHEHYRTPPEVRSLTDREAFRARLQQQFLHYRVNNSPFLLIAMRMERRDMKPSRPFDFEFVLDLAGELCGDNDDIFVDMDRERLIVVLADTAEAASPQFFSRLKSRLHEEAPEQADNLLQSVSAIVVPNGQPFQNAEEFLSYALDEL